MALGALELKFWNFCDMVQQPSSKASDISTLVTEFFDKKTSGRII
jgi:hypothetical protein